MVKKFMLFDNYEDIIRYIDVHTYFVRWFELLYLNDFVSPL